MTTIPASGPAPDQASGTAKPPKLLLTRPPAAAAAFLQALGPWAGQVILSPLLDIVPVRTAPPDPAPRALVFTSKSAVQAYEGATALPAYCIGDATTAAARGRGFHAQKVGADAADLVARLPALQPPEPLVHVRGVHVAKPVSAQLARSGLRCGEWIVYDQVARVLSDEATAALATPDAAILPVFSPRSADLLGRSLREIAPVADCIFVVISPAVAARIIDHLPNARVFTADAPDAAAMVDAVHASARHADALEGRRSLP
jgi:uroporphyrinogen-III synthase